ncbi:putative lipoprotein [Nautilia profundicola AmH]|uniref:Lipoprotein n=1 Tax=Nautilia profundicola (strain ATCC BAA-1463 / DSM 18972 / AmH) TaxID=598659 RepID=B9L9S8_NAUPA|nr:putative lipoprotein [Nautilia profundicola AmH]
MVNYMFRFFHIVIITFFLIGCGYKADPVWPGKEQNKEVNQSDLKIIEINSTLNIK